MLGGKTYRHLYEEVRQRSTEALYDEFIRPSPSTAISPARCLSPQPSVCGAKPSSAKMTASSPPTNPRELLAHPGRAFTHLPKTPHYLLGHFRRWEELW